jgi:hypothetical protein
LIRANKKSYSVAAPTGVNDGGSLTKSSWQLANSPWLLALGFWLKNRWNLRQLTHKSVKSTPIWDGLGCTPRDPTPIWDDRGGGVGAQSAPIAEIAGIADIARDRKSKAYR